ncbi:hypothetical protein GPJ56_002897 [Histomonas meleagridis]|uniref:uncharacterized protein n=1 Tax=Histomonas meleagridis TaxID=135588 RepID=UPI00355AB21D|nr:hypothetical protein GPJ56_002897 [Histomonas meleagridis]KAH0800402.1 hypothetical protein GO595_006813 [Histomonas meleagridis]
MLSFLLCFVASSKKCFNFCEKFNSTSLEHACKVGCLVQSKKQVKFITKPKQTIKPEKNWDYVVVRGDCKDSCRRNYGNTHKYYNCDYGCCSYPARYGSLSGCKSMCRAHTTDLGEPEEQYEACERGCKYMDGSSWTY